MMMMMMMMTIITIVFSISGPPFCTSFPSFPSTKLLFLSCICLQTITAQNSNTFYLNQSEKSDSKIETSFSEYHLKEGNRLTIAIFQSYCIIISCDTGNAIYKPVEYYTA